MNLKLVSLAAASAATLVLSLGAASAAEPTAKWCEGVKIAAFPGGPQGGVFANNVYNGFRQAELDLGPTVTYYFSDWDPNKMLQQIQQAVALVMARSRELQTLLDQQPALLSPAQAMVRLQWLCQQRLDQPISAAPEAALPLQACAAAHQSNV